MKNERFNIAIKVKKFIFDINDLIVNFPKKDYDIKDRLKYSCYELLRLVYRANYSKDKYEYQMDILTNISKNNKINLQTTFCSITTYFNGFKYGSRLKIKRIINKHFYS